MAKWDISLHDTVDYEIEAETEEEAFEIALEYWAERIPGILWCHRIKEDE